MRRTQFVQDNHRDMSADNQQILSSVQMPVPNKPDYFLPLMVISSSMRSGLLAWTGCAVSPDLRLHSLRCLEECAPGQDRCEAASVVWGRPHVLERRYGFVHPLFQEPGGFFVQGPSPQVVQSRHEHRQGPYRSQGNPNLFEPFGSVRVGADPDRHGGESAQVGCHGEVHCGTIKRPKPCQPRPLVCRIRRN